FPPEAGGVNMIVPMAVAGSQNIPIIDADSMGRAFPEFQMSSFYINDININPVVSVNEKGHCSIVDSKDGIMSEKIMRSAAISYGGISWYAGVPIKGKDIKDFGILNTISLAWKLGKGVYESRKKNESPLDN